MMAIAFAFVCSLSLSALFVPLVLKAAHRRKLYDKINERTIHSGNIPRLGGLGIFLSFAITISIMAIIANSGIDAGGSIWAIIFCVLVVYAIGLLDDFQDLRARYKFFVELASSIFLSILGFRFLSIPLPFGLPALGFGVLGYPLTIVWIIGITNALNLIDGMDGLAGGIAVLSAAVFGVFFVLEGDIGAALVSFTLMGAVLGFLIFNFPPAKIFMGDSGALFIGFALSILPLIGSGTGHTEIGFIPAVTVLIIPIYDTFAAIIRRSKAGVSVFTPDKLHVHHKLLNLGLRVRGALIVIYCGQGFLCLVALSSLIIPNDVGFVVNIGTWILFASLFFILDKIAKKNPINRLNGVVGEITAENTRRNS